MNARSGSLNFSPALNVLSKTACVSMLRILIRTSVCPPRAVGLETSTSRQLYGAPSYSKYDFRLISIASIMLAMPDIVCALAVAEAFEVVEPQRAQGAEHHVGQRRVVRRPQVDAAFQRAVGAAGEKE